ncbi:hypothetical protein KUH32_04610 [Thalassococcus sp. CAU 1522]|uniref:Uncharacterized protein n=2 Tax=Thalassococcus arenae TaxID=2851652 RepID=A0ABS6N4W5_9RHOB|nr:hypothetical protein [Thalassococcus arenae]MBV2359048.1 hypothetical protein [Thalassococcus arenae]
MGTKESSPEEAARAAYRHDGPPEIVLYTMINNRSGSGAHTSIMINAPSQRVIFDPAGSVQLSVMPEIGDVLYGITPSVLDFYERAHARSTYHVRIQRLPVSPQSAERALRLVQANGIVPAAQCTTATSRILSQVPEFSSVRSTLFPNNLADQVAQIPGVTERRLYENDGDDKELAIAEFEARNGISREISRSSQNDQ